MHANHRTTALRGKVTGFNLSPKGVPEGFLLQRADSGAVVQVNFDPEIAGQITEFLSEAKAIIVDAGETDSHVEATHPVFDLVSLSDAKGEPLFVADGAAETNASVRGKVVRLNHARRGEVNGGILDSGEFVHLKPHGVKTIGGLSVGQILEARGEVRAGWAGHRVIEAHTANGIEIGKSHKEHGPKHKPPHKPPGPKHTPKHKATV